MRKEAVYFWKAVKRLVGDRSGMVAVPGLACNDSQGTSRALVNN
jgi:hypothetical protein